MIVSTNATNAALAKKPKAQISVNLSAKSSRK